MAEVNITVSISGEGKVLRMVASTSVDMTNPIYSPTVRINKEFGYVKTVIGGLAPDTIYYIAAQIDGVLDTTRVGSFRTPKLGPHSFKFGTASCNRTGSESLIWDAIRGRAESGDIQFFIHTGDYGYPNIVENEEGLFHTNYDLNIQAARQSEAFRACPWYYVWDDHDYGDNDSGANSPSRAAAISAYKARVPAGILADDSSGSGIYHSFERGRVKFIMSDCRSDRSAKGEYPHDDPRQVVFGTKQMDWFKSEILDAKSKGFVVCWVNSMVWIDTAGTGKDTWGGYSKQRSDIRQFLYDEEMNGRVFIISGDMHALAYDDGSSPNNAGSLRVIQSAPIDQTGSGKGSGPYKVGPVFDAGTLISQYTTLDIHDDGGSTISVSVEGLAVDISSGVESSVYTETFTMSVV